MVKSGRAYPAEYKARMVEYRAGRSADQLAREFEPSATAIRPGETGGSGRDAHDQNSSSMIPTASNRPNTFNVLLVP